MDQVSLVSGSCSKSSSSSKEKVLFISLKMAFSHYSKRFSSFSFELNIFLIIQKLCKMSSSELLELWKFLELLWLNLVKVPRLRICMSEQVWIKIKVLPIDFCRVYWFRCHWNWRSIFGRWFNVVLWSQILKNLQKCHFFLSFLFKTCFQVQAGNFEVPEASHTYRLRSQVVEYW